MSAGPQGQQTHPRGRRLRRRHVGPRTAGRGPVIPSMKRPIPIWMGPLKAARRWGELGADAREPAQLRYGVMDRPNRDVAPFRLRGIQLSPSDSARWRRISRGGCVVEFGERYHRTRPGKCCLCRESLSRAIRMRQFERLRTSHTSRTTITRWWRGQRPWKAFLRACYPTIICCLWIRGAPITTFASTTFASTQA
jgi:hypothetical protein